MEREGRREGGIEGGRKGVRERGREGGDAPAVLVNRAVPSRLAVAAVSTVVRLSVCQEPTP